MAKKTSMTKYVNFDGTIQWAHVYSPDTYRGATRWIMDFYMEGDEWDKFKELGIQKHPKTNENGTFWRPSRMQTKLMKGQLVKFTPPYIYDKEGNILVKYVDEDGKDVRSYTGDDNSVKRVGEPVLIGNGSSVRITVSVYPTAMGVGNRLESLRIVDLIEYNPDLGSDPSDEAEETAPW